MIKVLLVVCNNVLNGTERYVVDLASNLPKDIFDAHIATPMKGPLSAMIAKKGLTEVVYNNNKTIYYSFAGLRNLYKVIKSNKYDVIHANAKFHPCFVSKAAGAKFIVETKHGIFYSKKQLIELSFLRRIYERSKQYFTNKIIAISENDKRTLIELFSINKDKIKVIYNGLNFDDINEKIDKLSINIEKNNSRDVKIFNIGRLTFQKAQEVLIKAFGKIKSKHKNSRLVFIGTGENEKMLRNYVEEYGLDDSVIFSGYVDDIFSEMLKMDVLVLTSRFEGTPYVIFEAMALKKPVITTDVGGISNILTDGYDCLMTECDSPESTAEAIERLISDQELRNSIVANAYETVQKYTVQKMAEETARFYIENLNKSGKFDGINSP